jgi:hypothetical protein
MNRFISKMLGVLFILTFSTGYVGGALQPWSKMNEAELQLFVFEKVLDYKQIKGKQKQTTIDLYAREHNICAVFCEKCNRVLALGNNGGGGTMGIKKVICHECVFDYYDDIRLGITPARWTARKLFVRKQDLTEAYIKEHPHLLLEMEEAEFKALLYEQILIDNQANKWHREKKLFEFAKINGMCINMCAECKKVTGASYQAKEGSQGLSHGYCYPCVVKMYQDMQMDPPTEFETAHKILLDKNSKIQRYVRSNP